ncbi:MAG: NHLP leader peptide family RiPP precursor [Rivularia sp. (in: cyanobacteria)]
MANTIEKRQDYETQIIVRALKDESFKQQLLTNPAVAKAEIENAIGQKVPDGFKVQVLQETADTAYLVLPHVPSTEGMTEEQLEAVASGTLIVDDMMGGHLRPCGLGSITLADCFPYR